MRDSLSNSAKLGGARPIVENDGVPKVAPKWLKHDRQVSSQFSERVTPHMFKLIYPAFQLND